MPINTVLLQRQEFDTNTKKQYRVKKGLRTTSYQPTEITADEARLVCHFMMIVQFSSPWPTDAKPGSGMRLSSLMELVCLSRYKKEFIYIYIIS